MGENTMDSPMSMETVRVCMTWGALETQAGKVASLSSDSKPCALSPPLVTTDFLSLHIPR